MTIKQILLVLALVLPFSCTELYESDGMIAMEGSRSYSDYYPGTEAYGLLIESSFIHTSEDSLSTFSIDVDNGSYTLARKKINQGELPDRAGVRIEEFVNYFKNEFPHPSEEVVAVYSDGAESPFRENIHLLRIGIKGKALKPEERQPWNLTFLVDVSGSMTSRMGLVKYALEVLVKGMREGDKLSICTYASGTEVVLQPTQIKNSASIIDAIYSLKAGGSTAMGAGLQNAYETNLKGFLSGGVNRIIVCSDGDANVGKTQHGDILESIRHYVSEGVLLSTIGFGQGNYKDVMMEQLADNGNGNYFYIDTKNEANRLFGKELLSMVQLVAKDVKVQVVFNPQSVSEYRLIGYDNREIDDDDFEKQETDAGEMGPGHSVTVLYELKLKDEPGSGLAEVKLHYKRPESDETMRLSHPVEYEKINGAFEKGGRDFRYIVGVGEFAERLKGRHQNVDTRWEKLAAVLEASVNTSDSNEAEFITLFDKAKRMAIEE